jgi:hypothetical protein
MPLCTMRAICAACAALALMTTTAKAQAELHFDAATVNLGEIRSSAPVTCHFSFVNNSTGPAEIVEVRPGCGCLQSRLDKMSLAPGERGVVTLDIRTLGQPAGPHTWTLSVFSKAGERVIEQILKITADVITEVTIQPAAVTLVTRATRTEELLLTDRRSEPLAIVQVETTTPWLRAQASPMTVSDSLGCFISRIHVEIAESCPLGRHDETVVIHTSDMLYGELKIAFTVVKLEGKDITATPSEVNLAEGSRFVRLTDLHDRPVVVKSVEADDPAINCHWAAGPQNQATLKLQIDGSKWNGAALATQVRVQISSPVCEELTIPVRVADRLESHD